MSKKIILIGLALLALILVAFAPVAQNPTRFRNLFVIGDSTFSGDVTVGGTINADAIEGSGDLDMNSNIITNIGAAGTDFGSTGGLTLADGLTVTSGGVGIGSDYALAHSVADQATDCGTSTITDTEIIATGLTTATYVSVSMLTDPAATAAIVTADVPTTSTITVNVWESDFTVGTTGAVIHWCAIGDQ